MTLDLRQLRYFVCVAERGSISGAAPALHVAQSAVSRQMRLLEEELGAPLFERSVTGARPTEAGALLLDRARFLLAEVESTVDDVSRLHKEVKGTVRLAAPSSIGHLLYFRIVDACMERFPSVQLEFTESPTESVLSGLLTGSLDLGVVTEPLPQPHLELSPLLQEGTVLVCRSEDPLAKRKRIHAKALSKLPVIISGGLRRIMRQRFEYLEPVVQLDGVLPALQLSAAGKGHAVLPESAALGHLCQFGLVSIPIQDFRIARFIATSRGRPTSMAVRALTTILREQVRELRL
jgi:DNA-binding transcriptional LysR family regulator